MLTAGRSMLALFLLLFMFGFVHAQDDLPKALLRVNEDQAALADKKYYLEVTADVALKDAVYQALSGASHPQIGILSSKGMPVPASGSFKNLLIVSPKDNGAHKVFRMYLPDTLAPFTDFAKKKFAVILTNDYLDAADQPQIRAIAVDRVLSRDLATDYPVCRRNQFGMSVAYDFSDDYSRERVKQLYDYLDGLRTDPTKLQQTKILVEPLTRKQVESRYVTGVTIAPAKKSDLNGVFSACFSTDGDVPSEKFDAQLVLSADAPIEFVEPKVVPGLSGISAEAVAEVFPSKEKAVGIRPIDKDLNLAFSLVSAVKDVDQPNKTTLRQRNTVGTLDLRIGLFRDLTQLTVKTAKLGIIRLQKECGPVTAYTAATAGNAGSVKIGGNPVPIAPGLSLSGVIVGAELCLHYKYLTSAGEITDRNPG